MAALSIPAQANPNPNCGPRADMLDRIDAEVVSAGLSSKGNLIEVYANKAGVWALTVTDPSGKMCVASQGDNWRQYETIWSGSRES